MEDRGRRLEASAFAEATADKLDPRPVGREQEQRAPAFAEATADKGGMGREASPRWRIEVGGERSEETGARRRRASGLR